MRIIVKKNCSISYFPENGVKSANLLFFSGILNVKIISDQIVSIKDKLRFRNEKYLENYNV